MSTRNGARYTTMPTATSLFVRPLSHTAIANGVHQTNACVHAKRSRDARPDPDQTDRNRRPAGVMKPLGNRHCNRKSQRGHDKGNDSTQGLVANDAGSNPRKGLIVGVGVVLLRPERSALDEVPPARPRHDDRRGDGPA